VNVSVDYFFQRVQILRLNLNKGCCVRISKMVNKLG
jgi:hypothetical protein